MITKPLINLRSAKRTKKERDREGEVMINSLKPSYLSYLQKNAIFLHALGNIFKCEKVKRKMSKREKKL